MERIVIISSTNRPGSNTLKVCRIYKSILESLNVETELFDFQVLPENMLIGELYGKRSDEFSLLINKYITENTAFLFVIPEYNGGFPGILKTFIDAVPPKEWTDKKACLVGISNGRAGNLRGTEHFTGVLNYLKVNVYHNKLPVSGVDKLIGNDNSFNNEEQMRVCTVQMEGFLDFIRK
jgi:chromate reductase, NAD(P)H dehydrogenase (quinone)